MTNNKIETIKKRIKSYRAILSGEKRKFGGYFDNQGLRYEIIFPDFTIHATKKRALKPVSEN